LRATTVFQKACDLNYDRGCFNLGLSYEEGKGVKQDDFKAVKFYQKACDLNSAKIQITRLLEKLECFEIILFNAFASFIHKSKKSATTAIKGV
jgi:hypothetical protein